MLVIVLIGLVHGRAVGRMYKNSTTITKFLHNILPTGVRVNKYSNIYSPNCPTCHHDREDDDHLIRCPAREPWRRKFCQQVRNKALEIHTDDVLLDLLLEGIQSFFDARPANFDQHLPHRYKKALREQASIGWNNFLKGRLSKQWLHIQEDHLVGTQQRTNKINGETWAVAIIHTMWKHWLELWESRNEDRHGKDQATRSMANQYQASREVQLLYEKYQGRIMAQDNHIFNTPLHEMLEKPYHHLRDWVLAYQSLLPISAQQAIDQDTDNTIPINVYFEPDG